MPNKEDLRVRKTKKALFEAFMKLLYEKPFDEITVNELCDTAGIRRATFYKHYSDKFDFLTAYTRLLRDTFDRTIWKSGKPSIPQEYYVEYAKKLIYFISDHWDAVQNICYSHMFPSVLAIIFEQNFRDTCQRLRISVSEGMIIDASIETVSAMCTGGVAACIYSWIAMGRKTDPSVVAEQVGALVANVLKQE
jgi:AcrR family transcriptional regulator